MGVRGVRIGIKSQSCMVRCIRHGVVSIDSQRRC